MLDAVIFDMDGTLLDSNDLHARAWQDAFADFGHIIELEALRAQIGKGGDQLMPVFLSPEALEQTGKALESHRSDLFRDRYREQVRPFAGVRALFEALHAAGVRIALASSAKGEELAFYRKRAAIDDLVEAATTSDDAERSKPHPDIFAAALAQLKGADRAAIRVVGDTPYDAQAACKAGLTPIGVTCGGWSEAALRQAGCAAVYEGPGDLLAQLDRWAESRSAA